MISKYLCIVDRLGLFDRADVELMDYHGTITFSFESLISFAYSLRPPEVFEAAATIVFGRLLGSLPTSLWRAPRIGP
jgi:hypothetical protein